MLGTYRLPFALPVILLVASGGTPTATAQVIEREGRFIKLFTDLDSEAEADQLVTSFDTAVVQWLDFWKIPPESVNGWQVQACVIRNRERFSKQGLIPPSLPHFPFGYALGKDRVWVLAQQSEYYTRHLLLHEGVHSLSFQHFGGTGPTWFREGTAELLATHRGQGAELTTNQVPKSRDEVPFWGRFKLMRQLRSEQAIPSLNTVMGYRPDLVGDVASYGWSWAATMLLSRYPDYQQAFVEAAQFARRGPGFNRQLKSRLQREWPIVAARWRIMCHELDYGFDWERERVELSVRDPPWDGSELTVRIEANRGWQSAGVRVPPGARLRLTPQGTVVLAETTKPWTSQPAGITFQYHRGRPLGQLLLCVLPNRFDPDAKTISPLDVRPVDRAITFAVNEFSWILLRVNDAVGELADNQGSFEVTLTVDRS